MEQTALTESVPTVLEAIQPFQADDGHKGTLLVLRIAGMEQSTALRLINRKYRSVQNWRSTDEDFRRLDDMVPTMALQFGGEARVLRTALLDISIIEAGILMFKRILSKQPMTDGMWTYATKMAGLRVPVMGAHQEVTSPWEKIANAIKQTMAQREVVVVEEPNGTRTTTAREVVIEPSPEQKQAVSEIVQRVMRQAAEGVGES